MVKRKKRKDRQYNGQKKIEERQTIQWSKENRGKRDNTTIVLSVFALFSFDHCIVCLSTIFF
jgi:hypothetical protein